MLTEKQKERYSRQILSDSIREEGQEKLGKTNVLQIGAGGLGSPFSLYLVAAGIGKLTIIDDDIVSLSNLQRQILYNEDDIGNVKVNVAKNKLSKTNSDVKIEVFKDFIDKESIEALVMNVYFLIQKKKTK
ncbi:MAG: ThiF family adenylyltransferase [Candidatus Lokiarchaeota archaeon]